MICSLQSQYKEFYRLLNSVKCTAELIYWYKAKLCSKHTVIAMLEITVAAK